MVHLPLLVRKLACAVCGCRVHHHRRFDLPVACGNVLVEEEIDESPLQFRSLALVNRETGSGYLYAEVEVDDVIFPAKLPMWKRSFRKYRLGAAHLDHEVVLGSLSLRHDGTWNVREKHESLLKFPVVHICLGEQGCGPGLEFGHLLLCPGDLVSPAGLHERAYL